MLVAYARTSTTDQAASFEAQQVALTAAGCEKTFAEQTSAIGARPQLEAALDWVRDGDTLVACKLDRLARSTADLLKIIERLDAKGAGLRILDFGGAALDTKAPTSRLMLTVLSAIAQFERELMLERQKDGIAKAKLEGKYKGRVPTARRQAKAIVEMRREGHRPDAIAAALSISRASVFRQLRQAGLTAPPAPSAD
jgi:DNA invertase Pin-like site-specific DNA recombinase